MKFIGYGLIFASGVLLGLTVHSKNIDYKIARFAALAEEVKEKNNKMVSNLAKIQLMQDPDSANTFTDFDAELMDMWID